METEGDTSEMPYVDYSETTEESMTSSGDSASGSNDQNFPSKLHFMLEEVERDRDPPIVWAPHGRAFMVNNQKAFVNQLLPNWFRQTKLSSFQRQLNLYGFKRLSTGRDKGAYYHEMFLRGKAFLAKQIKRVKIKGQGPRKPNRPETEPNFYTMKSMPQTNAMLGQQSLNGRAANAFDASSLETSRMLQRQQQQLMWQHSAPPVFPLVQSTQPHPFLQSASSQHATSLQLIQQQQLLRQAMMSNLSNPLLNSSLGGAAALPQFAVNPQGTGGFRGFSLERQAALGPLLLDRGESTMPVHPRGGDDSSDE